MLSDLTCLLWLQRRHARAELNFYLWAAGADLDDQGDLVERLYLLYVVALLGAAAVAGWLWVIGLVEGAVAPIGQSAEMRAISADLVLMAAGAALALPLLCAAAWCVRAAWTPPLQLSAPDRAVLAQAPVRAELWALISMAPQLTLACAAGIVGGYLVADAAVLAMGGVPGPAACLPYALALGLGLAAARAAAWAVGMARLRLGRAARVPLTLGAAAAAAALALLALICQPAARGAASALLSAPAGPILAAAVAAAAGLALVAAAAAHRLPARSLTVEAAADADLYAVRRMALYSPQLYRDLRRRARAAQRRPIGRMPRWNGPAAPLARAAVSAVRRYDTLPRILATGALLAPLGAYLLGGEALAQTAASLGLLGGAAGGRILGAASWALMALRATDLPRELARVYRDDAANRLVRPHVPFSPFTLFALDTVPALAMTAAASCAAAFVAGPAGGPGLFACALALDVVLACCGAFDTVESRPGRLRVSCEAGLVVAAVLLAILSAAVPAPYTPLAFWGVALSYLSLAASSL